MTIASLIEELGRVSSRVDERRAKRILRDAKERLQDEVDRIVERDELRARVLDLENRPIAVAPVSKLEDPILTREEVMEELYVSHDYLNDLRLIGVLVGFFAGGRKYQRSEVDEYLRKRKIPHENSLIERKLAELRKEKARKREQKKAEAAY